MWFLISTYLLVAIGYVLGECSDGCSEPTLLYDELNCKPIFASFSDCCPSHYDCSNVEQKGKETAEKCHFLGKSYNSGEAVNDDDTYGNCQVGCSCIKKNSGKMGFQCAVLDCPEWLGHAPEPGCYFKYELNKCCGSGQVCPPYNATCKIGDKVYHEGERFDAPGKKCTACICDKGFEGKFEGPFCKIRGCVEEIVRQTEVYSFCAPSYLGKDDCCPFNWICPEKNDTIITAETDKKSDADLKCKFGETTLNIGDKFERTHGEKGQLSCECRIPPYLTCIQNFDYPAYASDIY